jgi:hypothetical protein
MNLVLARSRNANLDSRPALTDGENAMPKEIVKGFDGRTGKGRMKIEGRCHCGGISYEADKSRLRHYLPLY